MPHSYKAFISATFYNAAPQKHKYLPNTVL
uniref:Uncharacterized protein n=1 Tax=Anguilla anguilla TaxID=7936 RepID=A0A0E9VGV7_ANGAN